MAANTSEVDFFAVTGPGFAEDTLGFLGDYAPTHHMNYATVKKVDRETVNAALSAVGSKTVLVCNMHGGVMWPALKKGHRGHVLEFGDEQQDTADFLADARQYMSESPLITILTACQGGEAVLDPKLVNEVGPVWTLAGSKYTALVVGSGAIMRDFADYLSNAKVEPVDNPKILQRRKAVRGLPRIESTQGDPLSPQQRQLNKRAYHAIAYAVQRSPETTYFAIPGKKEPFKSCGLSFEQLKHCGDMLDVLGALDTHLRTQHTAFWTYVGQKPIPPFVPLTGKEQSEYLKQSLAVEVGRGTKNALEVATVLCEVGVNPNAVSKYGQPPLYYAVESLDATKLLLRHKVDPNAAGIDRDIPLNVAACNWADHPRGNLDVICALLEAGANPNVQDKNGNTALHAALFAPKMDSDVIDALLDKRTNPNITNIEGQTALHVLASDPSHPDPYGMVTYALINAKANPNAIDCNGKTPLHLAVAAGNASVVAQLVAHGANQHLKDNTGKIPLDYLKDAPREHQEAIRNCCQGITGGKNMQAAHLANRAMAPADKLPPVHASDRKTPGQIPKEKLPTALTLPTKPQGLSK